MHRPESPKVEHSSFGLFQDDGGAVVVATRGEGDGCGENERAADPGVGAEMFTEQVHAEVGAERGFNIQENSGARSRHMMDAPVPKERGGGGAEEAAHGERYPGG